MKRIVYFIACLFLLSCTKEQVQKNEQQAVAEVPTISGVTVVDGMLKFNSMTDAHDAVQAFYALDEESRKSWAESIGFKSAYILWTSYLEEFDELKTRHEFNEYKKAYGDQLTITEGDEIEVDLPVTTNLAPLLSQNGGVVIDNVAYLFFKDRNVRITDYTPERLSAYIDATQTNQANGVFVDYFVQTRASGSLYKVESCFPENGNYHVEGKRKYRIELRKELEYYDRGSYWDCYTIISLFARSMKKNSWLGGWRTYECTYHIEDLVINLYGGNITTIALTSLENQGSVLYRFAQSKMFVVNKNNRNAPTMSDSQSFRCKITGRFYTSGITTRTPVKFDDFYTFEIGGDVINRWWKM